MLGTEGLAVPGSNADVCFPEMHVQGAVHLILLWLRPQVFSKKLISPITILPSSQETTVVWLWSRECELKDIYFFHIF